MCSDAFVTMGYTMSDITDSSKGYNFLFGRASFSDACGIFSFARYREDRPSPTEFFRRCAMVLCHEIGHLFGIAHCIYCKCLMSGSNHLDEAVSRPFSLCPADTIKLQARQPTQKANTLILFMPSFPSLHPLQLCFHVNMPSFSSHQLHTTQNNLPPPSPPRPPLLLTQLAMTAVGGLDIAARQRRLVEFFRTNGLLRDAGTPCVCGRMCGVCC